MLQELLRHSARDSTEEPLLHEESISILHFNLLPGGICRNPELLTDALNRRFSETVLESVKLLLTPALEQTHPDQPVTEEQKGKIVRLRDAIASAIKSGEVIAGGIFPQVVAKKAID